MGPRAGNVDVEKISARLGKISRGTISLYFIMEAVPESDLLVISLKRFEV